MVIQNTFQNLSNIVRTDFELGRVIQTVGAADPGITAPAFRGWANRPRFLSTNHQIAVNNFHLNENGWLIGHIGSPAFREWQTDGR